MKLQFNSLCLDELNRYDIHEETLKMLSDVQAAIKDIPCEIVETLFIYNEVKEGCNNLSFRLFVSECNNQRKVIDAITPILKPYQQKERYNISVQGNSL